jgi:hypothetical protein
LWVTTIEEKVGGVVMPQLGRSTSLVRHHPGGQMKMLYNQILWSSKKRCKSISMRKNQGKGMLINFRLDQVLKRLDLMNQIQARVVILDNKIVLGEQVFIHHY